MNTSQKYNLLPICGLVVGVGLGRFRGGLVLKAHRHLYHSNLGSRVIKKEEEGYWRRVSELGQAVEEIHA